MLLLPVAAALLLFLQVLLELLRREPADANPERRQAQVDVLRLLEPVADHVRLLDLLGPGKVDQVQAAVLLRVQHRVFLLEADPHDAVRA